MKAAFQAAILVALAGSIAGQPPDTFTIRTEYRLRLVSDSPEVRRLIADEEKRQIETEVFWGEHSREEQLRHVRYLMEHPQDISPERRQFLDAMAAAPALSVQRKTRAKVLAVSKARCLRDGLSTTTFVRMLLAGKSPPGGAEVWVCLNGTAFDNVP